MLGRIGTRLALWVETPWPWGRQVGVARTMLAVSSAGTLLFNRGNDLFLGMPGEAVGPACQGLGKIGLFCVIESRGMASLLGVMILGIVASGLWPRFTCIPHWWVASSLFLSASVADGGEQVAAVLTVLLVPICITDGRRWHWSAPPATASPVSALIARTGLLAIHVQVTFLYFHAAVGKLGVEEWANGTAIYYWFLDPLVNAPGWLVALAGTTFGTLALTWGTLVIEGALAFSLFMPHRVRQIVIGSGFALHLGIWITMGLASFSIAMFAALLLLAYSGQQGGAASAAAEGLPQPSLSVVERERVDVA